MTQIRCACGLLHVGADVRYSRCSCGRVLMAKVNKETDDEIRARLLDALFDAHQCPEADPDWELAVALLPTVRRIVADELRAAADIIAGDDRWKLRARADVLDPREAS